MAAATDFPRTWFLNGGDFPDEFIDGMVKTLNPPFDDFDIRFFTRLVLGSLSLALIDKNRIFESLPTLSHWQLNELNEVFIDELDKFKKLTDDFRVTAQLSAACVLGAFCLAIHRGAGYPDREREGQAIFAMAKRKLASNQGTLKKLEPSAGMPLVAFVYGDFSSVKSSLKKKNRAKRCKPFELEMEI